MSKERKLAAIMFTDIVGYTALMGEDEHKAFELLKKNRQIQKPIIKKYNGRWLKEMGDGILASFSTISDAVNSSVEIQKSCEQEPDLKLRIGIHQGEIVYENGDVFGDGVNIASRLEALAPVGGIYVSESVFRNTENKEGFKTSFVKEESLKNVKHPVRIYEIIPEESTQNFQITNTNDRRRRIQYITGVLFLILAIFFISRYIPKKTSETIEKSIAVLPFKDLSGAGGNQYFCDGIMDGILNNLSKIKDLRVVSRSSTERYRNNIPHVQQISKDLKINYLLEASVFKHENRVRVIAQLINARMDKQIWSKEYDRELSDIFDVMSEIAKDVASEIEIVITPQTTQQFELVPTDNIDAFDIYLQGREFHANYKNDFIGRESESDLKAAMHLYQQALELDPEFALAYAWLGIAYHDLTYWSEYFKESFGDTLIYFANKTLSINPEQPEGHFLRGMYLQEKGDYIGSIDPFRKVVELNPNHGDAYWRLALGYEAAKQYVDATESLLRARDLKLGDPDYPSFIMFLGDASMAVMNYDRAESSYSEIIKYDPLTAYHRLSWLHEATGEWKKVIDYGNMICAIDSGVNCLRRSYVVNLVSGNYKKAKEYYDLFREDAEGREFLYNIIRTQHRHGYILYNLGEEQEALKYFNKQIEYCLESIRLNRPYVFVGGAHYDLAATYAFLGERDKTYEVLHEMENRIFRGWSVWYMQVDPLFESLWEDEEFKAIVRRQTEKFDKIRFETDQLGFSVSSRQNL